LNLKSNELLINGLMNDCVDLNYILFQYAKYSSRTYGQSLNLINYGHSTNALTQVNMRPNIINKLK
jgi:hypothetical protein